MKGVGPREERETIIRWDEASDEAELWTASEITYRRMKKKGHVPVEDGTRHAVFVVRRGLCSLPRLKKRIGKAKVLGESAKGAEPHL